VARQSKSFFSLTMPKVSQVDFTAMIHILDHVENIRGTLLPVQDTISSWFIAYQTACVLFVRFALELTILRRIGYIAGSAAIDPFKQKEGTLQRLDPLQF
jgi:hypothetical protein